MQLNMKNSSEQTTFGKTPDIFFYTAEVPKYFILEHKCNSDWTSNASNSESHLHCEITVYVQDQKCVFVNDSMYISQAPCIFTFLPGEYHYDIHSIPNRHERYVLRLFQDNFFRLPGGRELLRCLYDRKAGEYNMILLPQEDQREAFRLLDSILLPNNASIEKEALMLADMIRFLSLLNRHYLNGIQNTSNGMSELFRRILFYIKDNLNEPLRVSRIADQFQISQSTLERMFRNSLTISPKEYIVRCRMDTAKKYLQQGQSVTDACNNAGFSDYSRFIADFRKLYNTTPAEYARKHRHNA